MLYFALFLPISVNYRQPLSTIVNFLYDLSNQFSVANLRDPNTVQKWAEKQVSTMTIANTSKKKGAHNERLINQ